MATQLHVPLDKDQLSPLRAGDSVEISGVVYTARDAAHGKLFELLDAGEPLPIDLAGGVIYYCGPAPTPPGSALGSAGPTTSYRMDSFAPRLYELGLGATIGKGDRGIGVREACRQFCCVYLVAVGGAGALLSERVVAAEVVAYPELGPEAIRRLEVERLPAIVAYDTVGNSVFPHDDPLQ
ncbi:MAG TPA: TRZ/ATZ family protein [Armatimonadetes bacterium]|jgi:fumarate hydratase subunit beta|nr:TRZ/ATZ family protein [Armatimonadota bacterium]